MKPSRLKYTIERMSGMPSTVRKMMESSSFLASPLADSPENHRHHSLPTISDNSIREIDLSTFSPFGLSTSGTNDILNKKEHISGDQLIDDFRGDQNDFLKAVDRRIMKMRRHYRSIASNSPSRRILVVGAGPVGLRCAIGAALAGNQVTIIEQHESEARARYLGLFPPEQQYLATIGAPKSMFPEVSIKGIPKRAVTLPDLQLFLKAVALKVGVALWLRSKAIFNKNSLKKGAIQCVFCPSRLNPASPRASQMVCLNEKKSNGMGQEKTLNFDIIVDATGTHSDLKRILFGKRIVGFRTIGKKGMLFDGSDAAIYHSKAAPTGASFLLDQANKINRWEEFVEKTLHGHADILDNIGCFVGNIDRSVFYDDRSLDLSDYCPPDWLWKQIPRPINNGFKSQERFQSGSSGVNNNIFRIQFEGPFPQNFKGSRTIDLLHKRKRAPIDIISAFIKTSGAGAHIHKENWSRYCSIENGSTNPVQNTASLFTCQLTGIQTFPDTPSLWGVITGSRDKEYFIAGDAAQSAWYRFGTGILDGFYSASIFDELLRIDKTEKIRLVTRWERYLRQRAVQVLYSIYSHQQLLKENLFMDKMLENLCSDNTLTF
jgi:FAD binding domain